MNNLHAYTAGIIDGEGCITLYRSNHGGRSNIQYCPRIQVNMGDVEPLLVLEDLYGGSLFIESKPRSPKHRLMYSWYLSNRADMIKALDKLLPHLRVKNIQAEVLLHYFNRYECGAPHEDSKDIYVNLIRALNGKDHKLRENVLSLIKTDGLSGVLDG